MKHEAALLARATVHEGLSTLKRPLGDWRFRKAAKASTGHLLVSAGAGRQKLSGWLNTDVSWRSKYYLDLTTTWPIEPGSVDRIYADNVIEHFSISIGRRVLLCAFNALGPGGRIRLATPDVERTARAYLENGELAARHLERHRSFGYEVHYPVDLLRVTFSENGHHTGFCYDWNALSTELEKAGFLSVIRLEAGDSDDPLLKGLELRTTDTEAATSLIVEATKPDRGP